MPIQPVLANDDPNANLRPHTLSYPFPDYAYGRRVDRVEGLDFRLCSSDGCTGCLASSEAATIHSDCFALFRAGCASPDALDRLWRVAAWRRPWRTAPLLDLPDAADLPLFGVRVLAERCGMPRLGSVTAEIVAMIRSHSASAAFWRLACALQLARELDSVTDNEPVSMPLRAVGRWRRGCPPPVASAPDRSSPFVRLTIDSHGISEVEGLPDWPEHGPRRFDHLAFAVLDTDSHAFVVAQFKVAIPSARARNATLIRTRG